MLKLLINFAADPWPFTERLKHPNLSPARLSDPHWSRMASGLKFSMIFPTTGLKM
jgi:hypothetical protein